MFVEPAGFFEIAGGQVHFPDECFVCGAKAEKGFSVHRLQFTAFYIIVVKYRKMKIKVPVCNRHFWQLITMKTLLWTIIITGPFVLALSADIIGHTYEMFIGMATVLFLVAYKYLSMKNNFRIYAIGDSKTTFSVKREEYLLKLLDLNNVDPTMPSV